MHIYRYLILLATTLLYTDDFYNSQSFQGFTGIINTPNAEVLEEGKTELQISNQIDSYGVNGSKNHRDRYIAEQYMINFGLMPNFEMGGRLAHIEDKDTGEYIVNDLSASIKYQIPFYRDYLPKIAIGIQDLGGQADKYDAKYIVASKEYKFIRGSIGFGIDSSRMDGLFGGVEVKANNWTTLLAEYDSQDSHVGVRVNTLNTLSDYYNLSFLAKANLDDDIQRFNFALNLKIDIGDKHHSKKILKKSGTFTNMNIDTLISPKKSKVKTSLTTSSYHPYILKEKLVDFGFENIDIGYHCNTVYIAYENNVLDHNELDAIGVVLGYLVELDAQYENFEIVTKRSNQKVRQITGNLAAYKNLFQNISPVTIEKFKKSIKVEAPIYNDTHVKLSVVGANSSYLKTKLEIYPGLKSFIGTDVGVFDYLLSVRAYIHWNLYKGFELGVLYDYPFMWSDDLNREHGRLKQYHQPSAIKSILLHRSDVFGNFINIASIGKHGDNDAIFENLTYTSGNHTLSMKLGYLEKKEYWKAYKDIKKLYLGTYSYYSDKYDTISECTYGQFYNQDYGFEVKAKRYFGDVAIGLIYQQTNEKYAGITIDIPLTPRKVPNGFIQIKGKNDFQYSVRTTVMDHDKRNILKPGGVIRAGREFDIERRFLNKNRLNTDYVKKHVLRLINAYIELK